MKPESALVIAFLCLLPCPLAGQDTERVRRERCDGGDLLSCNVLGLMYETGAGGTRDLTRAANLYQRACDGGVTAGCTRLQLTRESGAPATEADGFLRIGWVADAETGALIHEAIVDLPGIRLRAVSDPSGRVELGHLTVLSPTPVRTVSDPQGRFTLTGLEPGSMEVRFTRLGFAPRTTSLVVRPGRTVVINGSMSARPIELEPIEVTVGSSYLERSGFYRRARSASGARFTRRDVDVFDPQVVSDLLSRVPGVTVRLGPRGAEVANRRRINLGDGGSCHLLPYLDGMPMFDWDFDLVLPVDIEGVEVYQGSGAPIEYRNIIEPDGTYPCGVVLIWTRRP